LEQAAQGSGGVTIPRGVQKVCRCGTSGHGLALMVVLGWLLDLMILEVFSNLWFYNSKILQFYEKDRDTIWQPLSTITLYLGVEKAQLHSLLPQTMARIGAEIPFCTKNSKYLLVKAKHVSNRLVLKKNVEGIFFL